MRKLPGAAMDNTESKKQYKRPTMLPPLVPLAQRDILLHQNPSEVTKIEKLVDESFKFK
jgi:hypothetical protein